MPLRSNLREVNLARNYVGRQKPPHSCIDRPGAKDIPEFKLKLRIFPPAPNARSILGFHNAMSRNVTADLLTFLLVRGDDSYSKGGRPGRVRAFGGRATGWRLEAQFVSGSMSKPISSGMNMIHALRRSCEPVSGSTKPLWR